MNVPDQQVIAIDMGGTKVAAALVDQAGTIRNRMQEPTNLNGPDAGLDQLTQMIRQVMASAAPTAPLAVGIGIPAVIEHDTDHIIWAPNLPGWRDVPLRVTLAERLGLPVVVEYDGHTAILGEWWQGAGRGYSNIAGLFVGTGIGGGLILNGQLVRGHNRLAGAAGWFALTTDATRRDDPAHSIGHWESLAAGPGIVRRALARLDQMPPTTLASQRETLTAKDLFDAARQGDPFAVELINETADMLGLGVANIVSLINPEIIILGGSVGSQGDLLLSRVKQVVHNWAQPISAGAVAIVSSQMGADAGLLGAAYAAFDRLQIEEVKRQN